MAENMGSKFATTALQSNNAPEDASSDYSDFPVIHEGFMTLKALNGQTYLIPSFLADATCFAYHRESNRIEIEPYNVAGGVSHSFLERHTYLIVGICHSHIGIQVESLKGCRKVF